MQSSGESGMQTFDQHLVQLVREGAISETRALEVAHSKEEMQRLLRGGLR